MRFLKQKFSRLIAKQSELPPSLKGDVAIAVRSAAEEYQALEDYKLRLKSAKSKKLKEALKEAIRDESHHFQNFMWFIKEQIGDEDLSPADLPKMAASLQEWGGGPPTIGIGQRPDYPFNESAVAASGNARSEGGNVAPPISDPSAPPPEDDDYERIRKILKLITDDSK